VRSQTSDSALPLLNPLKTISVLIAAHLIVSNSHHSPMISTNTFNMHTLTKTNCWSYIFQKLHHRCCSFFQFSITFAFVWQSPRYSIDVEFRQFVRSHTEGLIWSPSSGLSNVQKYVIRTWNGFVVRVAQACLFQRIEVGRMYKLMWSAIWEGIRMYDWGDIMTDQCVINIDCMDIWSQYTIIYCLEVLIIYVRGAKWRNLSTSLI
jgi:hypothetical protein